MRTTLVIILMLIFSASSAFVAKSHAKMRKIENGKTVKLDYTLKVNGEFVDSTLDQKPLEYTHGQSQILRGLAMQLEGLQVGDEKRITIQPKDAFGDVSEEAVKSIARTSLPEGFKTVPGKIVRLKDLNGHIFLGSVWEINEENIVLNFNHPLAGKVLEFDVKILEID